MRTWHTLCYYNTGIFGHPIQRYNKVQIDNYIEILYYIHTSFISTLPPVKIRFISHFITFFPSLSITTYFHYPDTVRCTYIISVIYLSGYSENKLPTTSLVYLCAKKIQPIISNSSREESVTLCPLPSLTCLVCYR